MPGHIKKKAHHNTILPTQKQNMAPAPPSQPSRPLTPTAGSSLKLNSTSYSPMLVQVQQPQDQQQTEEQRQKQKHNEFAAELASEAEAETYIKQTHFLKCTDGSLQI